MNLRTKISRLFAAGVAGGFANALLIWVMGQTGIAQAMKVQIVPHWTVGYLYPKLVWGGIWGLIFAVPFLEGSVIRRGILFSLAPTAAVLFYVLPHHLNYGMMGIRLGHLVPVFALIVNTAWGITAAWWVRD